MRCSVHFLLATLCAVSLHGEDWSAFRGPFGNGIATAKNVPVEWSSEKNVAWKIDLPGASNGSPIVSGGNVFVVSAENDGHQRHLHCYSAMDGANKWVRTVNFDKTMPTHKTNLYGGTTPAADGQRVVVWHGSAGLFCYDLEGNEQWNRQFGEFRHQWGYGASPVLRDGKVILHSGPGQKVFVAGLDLKSGDTIWKTDEPVEHDGERNDANQYMGSWSTPVVATVDGKTLVVCSMATRVNAYDFLTGDIVWSCEGLRGERGDLAYASPVIADDICVAMGGFKGPSIGFHMTGRGDITKNRLWRDDKNLPQRIGSGVVVDGLIYMANAGANTIECIDPATGTAKWQHRSAGGAHWGSMTYADGRLYTTDQNGTTFVLRPSPERFEQIAANPLNEPGNSTPAFADGAVFVRTFAHLFCIRQDNSKS